MDDALLVHVIEGHQDLLDQVGSVFVGEAPAVRAYFIHDLQQVAVLEQLHNKVEVLLVFQELEHVNDVGVLKLLEHVELSFEKIAEILIILNPAFLADFDGTVDVDFYVCRSVDFAKCASTQQSCPFVQGLDVVDGLDDSRVAEV